MDPRNDIGQQALDLTELNVLWVQSLKHMSHGIHLLRCQVYRNRCSVRSSRWTSVTSSSASPRRTSGRIMSCSMARISSSSAKAFWTVYCANATFRDYRELEEPWDYIHDYNVWPMRSHPIGHELLRPSL